MESTLSSTTALSTTAGPLAMMATASVFLFLATVAVVLRVWVRAKVLGSWGWDDWGIVVCWGLYVAECSVLVSIAVIESQGLTYSRGEKLAVLIPAEQALYVSSTIILKLSLLVFYLRFMRHPYQRRILLTSTALYTTLGVILILLVTFQCGVNPFKDRMLRFFTGKCISFATFAALALTQGVLNALTDWIYTLLPISVLWGSMMPRRTKMSASVLVGLGVLGSTASCVRTAYIGGLKPTASFYTTSTDALIWTVVEPGLGIVAACCACLRPLCRGCVEGVRKVVSAHSVAGRNGSKGDDGAFGGRSGKKGGRKGVGSTDEEKAERMARKGRGILVTETMVKTSTTGSRPNNGAGGLEDARSGFDWQDAGVNGFGNGITTQIVGAAAPRFKTNQALASHGPLGT